MAIVHQLLIVPACCSTNNDTTSKVFGSCRRALFRTSYKKRTANCCCCCCGCYRCNPRPPIYSKTRCCGGWKLYARVVDAAPQTCTAVVEIPVTCYQIIGVPDRAEKDEIVKSVMHLKNAEVEEGYTMDVVVSRQNLLMDVRDKLLFEPEYAGNIREKVPPKSSLRIPWAWLPGALCLLQEVGQSKLVLDIGKTALPHVDAQPYIHDLLLSMALAECAIAKISFEANKISQGFEALARAQCLLRSKISLRKMTLLSQIEESLEDLAPACTLELLGMPHTPENAERRLGAIAALRELLRQGLDVETTCQVQDWPCFLNQALNKLMATEIVELLSWDNLATIRKNKKSLESQNQRVVIDFSCFYVALIAHIALGFSSKQTDLINKAKRICECLMASEGIDLKFEEAFCLFLLGQGEESVAAERLRQLEINANPTSHSLMSGKETRDDLSAKQSLESWLKDAVLGLFPDTRDCSPSVENFLRGEKKASANRPSKRAPQTTSGIGHRSLSPAIASNRRASDESVTCTNSSGQLGPAVMKLAASNLQGPVITGQTNSGSEASLQLERKLGAQNSNLLDVMSGPNNLVGNVIIVTILGCTLFATFKLMGLHLWRMGNTSRWVSDTPRMNRSTLAWTKDASVDQRWWGPAFLGNCIVIRLKKLLSINERNPRSQLETADLQSSYLGASQSSSMTARNKRPMNIEEAETLVKQWQTIKAEALGSSHKVHSLFEILDEAMLVQWQALADAAKTRFCFWRFVLLQLSVLRADIISNEMGKEMAEIEVLLKEAAELVDVSQPKNPNYYSAYTIRYVLKKQDDGSWRFCEGDILTPA